MMTLFIKRFIGALALDAAAFEEIEADRRAGAMALVVIALACGAGAFAAMGVNAAAAPGFAIAVAMVLGGWIVWAMLISAIGTRMLPEPQTRTNPNELFRTIGFAAAPGVFYAFAAMQVIAPFVFALVSAWMIAATVLAVRQALDYKSTGRVNTVLMAATSPAASSTAQRAARRGGKIDRAQYQRTDGHPGLTSKRSKSTATDASSSPLRSPGATMENPASVWGFSAPWAQARPFLRALQRTIRGTPCALALCASRSPAWSSRSWCSRRLTPAWRWCPAQP